MASKPPMTPELKSDYEESWFTLSLEQCSQNNSRFDISSDCVVIVSWFYTTKSAANDNTIGGNLKTGVFLRALVLNQIKHKDDISLSGIM